MIAENNNADCGNLYDQILSCPMIHLTGEQKDIPAPPLQDSSSIIRNNNYTHGITAKTRSFLKNKRSPTSSPPASPNRLKLLHKQPSLKRVTSLSLPYSGPRPELKSCLKKPSTPPRRCCRVSFSHVNLREYCRKVGDNPSVASGCPLSIGWKYNKKGKIDIDSYSYEADRSCVKLGLQCRRLSNHEREVLLTEIGGVSQSQILQGLVHAYLDRQLRRETLDSIGGLKNSKSIGPRERLYIMKESAARKLDRAKRGISPTQEQDKLWEHAHEAARNRSSSSSSTSSHRRTATCGW